MASVSFMIRPTQILSVLVLGILINNGVTCFPSESMVEKGSLMNSEFAYDLAGNPFLDRRRRSPGLKEKAEEAKGAAETGAAGAQMGKDVAKEKGKEIASGKTSPGQAAGEAKDAAKAGGEMAKGAAAEKIKGMKPGRK